MPLNVHIKKKIRSSLWWSHKRAQKAECYLFKMEEETHRLIKKYAGQGGDQTQHFTPRVCQDFLPKQAERLFNKTVFIPGGPTHCRDCIKIKSQ